MKKNKIILVTLSPKTHRTSEENLGLEYLKSSLESNNYKVKIIDAWLNDLNVDDVYNEIISEEDDILFVGISSYMSNTKPTIELIGKLKEKKIKIACGGFGPTFYPKEYLENGSDYVMRGEGEETIVQLAQHLEKKMPLNDIQSLGYKENGEIILTKMRPLLQNLDVLPFPSRDFIDVIKTKKSTVNMVSSRGCSGNCDFCSVISFFRLSEGRVWRTRSIGNIVDEIEELYKQKVKLIKLVDDSFVDGIRDETWCKEFADEIEKRDIHVKLRGQIRADKVTDEILFHLKRSGFYSFACGIENGSQTALSRMNKTATLKQNKEALELFKKYDYLVQMGFILFDKYTTMKELKENYDFLKKYDYTLTKGIFSEMFSAEGTKLNKDLKEQQQLKETNFIENNNKYIIDNIKVRKIYEALKLWHKSHSKIYDMTIDPLVAPKLIDDKYMYELYDYFKKLKNIDLYIFKNLIDMIESDELIDLNEYVNNEITKLEDNYFDIYDGVSKVYKKANLEYNAENNPFI